MLFRLLDLPTVFFQIEGIKWTMSWILLLSLVYTYTINKLSKNHERMERYNLRPRKDYYAQAKRLKAAQRADLEKQEKQRRIFEARSSFRLFDLPPELGLIVLSHCANWPSTYQSLVRTSRTCQRLTFHACLPRIPIRLITPEQVSSFDTFLRSRPKLAALIHHVWMTPLKEEQVVTSIAIVKKCNQLRSLASNAYIVQESISVRGGRLSHPFCQDLTLLSTRTECWVNLLKTSNGVAFFRQLTHLRLIGDRIPPDLPLPSLTSLSYGSSGNDTPEGNPSVGLNMLDDKQRYASLHTVILTKPRTSAGGLRISRAVAKKRLFIFELPYQRTELEIWCDNASQRGMWELCADPPSTVAPQAELKTRRRVRFMQTN